MFEYSIIWTQGELSGKSGSCDVDDVPEEVLG
jgi:hypothetical protein